MWLQGAWLSKLNCSCGAKGRGRRLTCRLLFSQFASARTRARVATNPLRKQTSPARRPMVVLLAAASAWTSTCSSPAARLVPSARLPPASLSGRARCSVLMVVDSVESTPNPSSFLLRLDAAPEGLAATGLRGQTFYGGDLLCPPAMAAALATEGVESIFACGNMLTVNKVAAAQWEAVLPSVVEALGGASEELAASGLQPATNGGAAGGGASSGGVAIRLQVRVKV